MTGIENNSNSIILNQEKVDIKLYPNPSDGKFKIEINTSEKNKDNEYKLEILNYTGETVHEEYFRSENNQTEITVSPEIKSGKYIVRLSNQEFVRVFKIIIDRDY